MRVDDVVGNICLSLACGALKESAEAPPAPAT